MQLHIFKDNAALSAMAAGEIVDLIRRKPDAVICLASGSTPLVTYALFVETAKDNDIDLSKVTVIGLDEWIGIPPDNEGSCHFFFDKHLLRHLNFSNSKIHLFNAMAANPVEECRAMDGRIREVGGIDLMLVGIGMNGHIGFNEPGASFDNYSHVIDLDDTTVTVGQKYFKTYTPLKQGITLGLKHLQEARKVLLLANGPKKAEIVKTMMTAAISNAVPATIIRQHPDGVVLLDEAAATLIAG